jgi:hypothetical protein
MRQRRTRGVHDHPERHWYSLPVAGQCAAV